MIPDPKTPGPFVIPDVLEDWLHECARQSWQEAKETRQSGGHDSHAEGVYTGMAEAFEFVIKAIDGKPIEL